jgi:kinetochor protein Mis14/NSL1
MDSQGHRKIELQSAADLSYLISNVRRAAATSINDAFPPVDPSSHPDAGGDELRAQIERLVEDYITKTFTLAAPNLTINGLPLTDPSPFLSGGGAAAAAAAEPEEQHEPFDGRKRMRVEDLTMQEEDLLREIAALKRRVPGAAAAAWAERVRAGVAGDEALLGKRREEVVRLVSQGDWDEDGKAGRKSVAPTTTAGKGGRNVLGDVGRPLERQADVERAFGGAVEALGRLKRDMPATVAKMERARVAGEYVVTER